MKAILLITLLACIACQEVKEKPETIEVVKCVLRQEVLFHSIEKLITAIQTKKAAEIAMTVLAIYPGIVDAVKRCLAENGEPTLQVAEWVMILVELLGPIVLDWIRDYGLPYVKKVCIEKFGSTWYCNAIPA